MRKLSELYKHLLVAYKKSIKNDHYSGLCHRIKMLLYDCEISHEERIILIEDFNDKFDQVNDNSYKKIILKYGLFSKASNYWWDPNDSKSRIKFIEMLIKLHQDEEAK